MHLQLWELPHDLRTRVAAVIRERKPTLAEGIASAACRLSGSSREVWRDCAWALVAQFTATIRSGELDAWSSANDGLSRFSPPLRLREIVRSIHVAECAVLNALMRDESTGATSESWPLVAHAVRAAAFEIAAAFAGQDERNPDETGQQPTLMSPHVFRVALDQEVARANRHGHGLTALLFDIGKVTTANHERRADRVTERVGFLARRFFRNHDWVARHGATSIAALLPETALEQAAVLAGDFCEMVSQRLVLGDFENGAETRITINAAVAGAETMDGACDGGCILMALEAAVLRAKLEGGNRLARVEIEQIRRTSR
jgi:diguanylate cyclase (GGDEF)-like protein